MPTPESPQLPNNPEVSSLRQELETVLMEGKRLVAEGRLKTDSEERNRILEEVKDIVLKAQEIRKKLGLPTTERKGDFDLEQFNSFIQSFLLATYKRWNWSEEQQRDALNNLQNTTTLPVEDFIIKLQELKGENMNPTKIEANKSRIGTITQLEADTPNIIEEIKEKIKVINPETEPWYKALKTKLQRTPHINEVIEETHKQYPNLILADLKTFKIVSEYIEQKSENSKEMQDKLGAEDGKWSYYFFPGSAFVCESGYWVCPASDWSGGDFLRSASRLDLGWGSSYRVVFLER